MRSRATQLFLFVGAYLVLSLLWFEFSDRLLTRVVAGDGPRTLMGLLQESVFVLVSAGIFCGIAWRRLVLDRRADQTIRRQLKASEARFRSLVQNSSDIINVVDKDGKTVFQTDSVSRVLGWTTTDDEGWNRVHEDDIQDLRTALRQARSAPGEQAAFVYRCLHADGSWRWLESTAVNRFDDPAVAGLVIHTRDVTANRIAEERLRAETEFTNHIIDSLPGLFYALDQQGNIVRANRAFGSTLGYSAEGIRSVHPFELFVEEDRAEIMEAVNKVFSEGSARLEASFRTADGRTVPYSLTGTRLETPSGPLMVGTGLDISEQLEAQRQIEELNRELNHRLGHITALREIDNAIVGSLDRSALLDTVLRQIGERLEVDAASVLLYSPGLGRLRLGASLGLGQAARRNTDLRLGQGFAGRAGQERRTVTVTGREAVAAGLVSARGLSGEGFESYIATPLVAKGQLLGVLEVFHREHTERSDDWHDVLSALAAQSALALENANLVESLQRSNTEMLAAYERTIEGWSRALDLRDEETEGHSRRVTEQTVKLAERFGIPEEQIVHIRRGALLHDIGKMGVPDHVLLKPGPLTDEEWVLMKQHPDFAYELLLPIEFLRSALDIPYSHHERWDGSGYPRGLKEVEIPLSARIFAVVDVYDALTSDRPYRPAWEQSRALAYLQENAGVQFDPQVVEEFVGMLAEERAVVDARALEGARQPRRMPVSR
ncbi:MAG: HD domain-containing phosphohydrolase [Trueperaceae bacterium]